jgi:hypothetical protein
LKNDLFHAFECFVEDNHLNAGLLEKNLFSKLLFDRLCGKVRAERPRGSVGGRLQMYAGIKLTDDFKERCDAPSSDPEN